MNEPSVSKYKPINMVYLKNHPTIKENWVQKILFDSPSLLGLGPLDVIGKERCQASGGRLDLLLQEKEADGDKPTRYEVEIQLGATDPSHIIRTIEYWDEERKRFPQYEHIAVIVAEDITARFFNVISLFNSSIPLIAIKMTAIDNSDGTVSLLFTRILDLAIPDPEEDRPEEVTDRAYWEKRTKKEFFQQIDRFVSIIKKSVSGAELSYTKTYLGFQIDKRAKNFVVFRPHKSWYYVDCKLQRSEKIDALIEKSKFEEILYQNKRYRLRVDSEVDDKESLNLVETLIQQAFEENK